MMKTRPHRFPPLSQLAQLVRAGDAEALQAQLADGFREGLDKGYREGHELGLREGRNEGRAQGLREGALDGRAAAQLRFAEIAPPVDAALKALHGLRADYQRALRQEVVDLVAKVARQVIRCELALQPVQLLALVDETLAAMPPVDTDVKVFLNPEELERIRELDPQRASRWSLVADARLEPGECRVKAGEREADAGCKQRLAACMEQVSGQLLEPQREAA